MVLPASTANDEVKGAGKCQAVRGKTQPVTWGARQSSSCRQLQQSHQQWRCLLSSGSSSWSQGSCRLRQQHLRPVHHPAAAAAVAVHSGNGSGPWGSGDGSSGMFTTSCVRMRLEPATVAGPFLQPEHMCITATKLSANSLWDWVMCRFQRWS